VRRNPADYWRTTPEPSTEKAATRRRPWSSSPPAVQPPPPAKENKPDEPFFKKRCAPRSGSYYSCEKSYGIFHNSRLVIGGLAGDVLDGETGMLASKTMGSIAFEGGYLGVPSSFAPTNFHGIEVSSGLRSGKTDFWFQFGTAVTVLNLGGGGPGTLRLGGSFGAGFNLAHGYGYIRARGAMILVPEKLDVEVSAQWVPPSASTSNYDERDYRASAWYRFGKSGRAVEVYVQKLVRDDAAIMDDREILDGFGGGVGLSLF